MSRRDYSPSDRYEDRRTTYTRRPRTERDYDEVDVDISRSRTEGPSRRTETVVKERERDETVVTGRRTERSSRQPLDFLREDYGRSSRAGPLVVREERRETDDDVYSRGGRTVREERREVDDEVYTRGPSSHRPRSRAPPTTTREETEEITFRERDRSRRPPYPPSESEVVEKTDVRFTESTKSASRAPSRAPLSNVGPSSEERIDIRIRERERDRPASRAPPSRVDFEERDVEEVRFRRGTDRGPPSRTSGEKETIIFREKIDDSSRGPPSRTEVDKKEEISIRESRASPPVERRGRDTTTEEIDIKIRERSRPPRQRSQSRGALVAREKEEWIVRRQRTPSPSPPPPPREFEKEEIIIRRKTRSPSPEPEPPREPTPEPPRPPPIEPIYRPPIIQEVITHHRHIDHGMERARSPSPPPPPSPPSPAKEENLEIEIKRSGVRNGKRYDEDIIFEQDISDRKGRESEREVSEREVERSETKETSVRRSVSTSSRRISPARRRYDDDVLAEADYYNRRVSSRAYPGEAYNGATRDWGVVDVPPGTERVRLDGAGGGRQEIYWDRYAGERRGKFASGDRVYEEGFGGGLPLPPPPLAERVREDDIVRETKITEKRIVEETSRGKTRDRMWTEVTKDLVTKEAIEEMGYEYEETDEYFYVMEYLRYDHVLRLVELTEEIRRERRERIREIRLEREEFERGSKMMLPPLPPMPPMPPAPAPPPRGYYDERFYERDIRYERDGRRRR